ncbi:hypothetical protein [Auritidibacter ignavus]|uniref:hypothetical protein n=1 Tax=Auritidibacter ignavus TaxID=678932 RepID=UPI0015D5E07F|nr:hypothetical protein [Auritidibacter ignavus]
MPVWSTLLIALGGILLGGSWSSYRQKFPLWVTVSFVVVGIMAIVAGFLTVPTVE